MSVSVGCEGECGCECECECEYECGRECECESRVNGLLSEIIGYRNEKIIFCSFRILFLSTTH